MERKITRIRKEFGDDGRSASEKYRDLFVGSRSISSLLEYEMMQFLSCVPGAAGLYLRGKVYPGLLGACGRNASFGRGVVFRHPARIKLGDNVIIDDFCLLDAKGEDNEGIVLGDNVFLGRNSILSCKNGNIFIGDGVNIGFNCEVFSSSEVRLGRDTMLAAYSYVIGGSHELADPNTPFIEQKEISSGVAIGENVWLGAGVKVLDGVEIGRGTVVGAGAVVSESLSSGAIAVGLPAKEVRKR